MKLSFCAKGTALVTVPGSPVMIGQSPRYVNRRHDRQRRANPAKAEPHEVDSTAKSAGRLTKITRRGDLWPHDQQTADHCGVKYVPITFKDGEWLVKSAAKPAKPRRNDTDG